MDITLTDSVPKILYSDQAPSGWRPLTLCNILILVGVTGVGKTTTANALLNNIPGCTLLPDRRFLTDKIIIEKIQREEGLETPKTRMDRYYFSSKFRQKHKEGMGKILANLYVLPQPELPLFLFDGLRGLDEVSCAIEQFPNARFIAMHTSDSQRTLRLLQRRDTFDTFGPKIKYKKYPFPYLYNLTELGLESEVQIIGEKEEKRLLEGFDYIHFDIHDLIDKIKIVAQDRMLYDPEKAIEQLAQFASERSIIVDTTEITTQRIIEQVLKKWF